MLTYIVRTIYIPAGSSQTYNYTFNHGTLQLTHSVDITVIQPINTVHIHVVDYDGNPVENVKVVRTNLNYSDGYNLVAYTDSSGWVTFTHVKNGTLKIDISWTNIYGQEITNETEILLGNNIINQTVILPRTTLVVHVYDAKHATPVDGAVVYLNESDKNIFYESTNSSGYVVFENIKGNIIYYVKATKNKK